MRRLAKIGLGLAAASCLLLAVERWGVEAAAQPGAKAGAPAAIGGVGLVDVQQSDLAQTAIEDCGSQFRVEPSPEFAVVPRTDKG